MTGADVNFAFPLVRLNPWYPGQVGGVEGASTDTGLRTHSTGTVFYVSPNHPGASDSRDGTDPNDPLVTIQAAVTRCESFRGDIIAVMPNATWQYSPGTPYPLGITEDAILDKHGVRIVGVSSSSVGVPWSPATDGGICLTVTGIDCVVEGFVFTEGAATGCNGIYAVYGGGAFADNLTVRHCMFDTSVDTAIHLDYTWYCHIHHNVFQDVDLYGIYSDSGGIAPTESPPDFMHVYDNVFHDILGGAAIWVPGVSRAYIHDNQLYHEDAQGAAAATDEGFVTNDGVVAGDENMVVRNTFSCQNTVVAAGDYGDLNGGSPTDCWSHSYCMNGLAYGIP